MKNKRFECQVDTDYINALGLTTYAFSRLEWQVVWCLEKITPNSINKITQKELTAGKIAKKFIDATRNMPKTKEREKLIGLSKKFLDLVELRNRIIHGKPCTNPMGQQRLWSNTIIEITDLENAADDFCECTNKLNEMYYGFLSN